MQQCRSDEARQARYAERIEPFLGPETPQAEDHVRRATVEYLARIRTFLAGLASQAGMREVGLGVCR